MLSLYSSLPFLAQEILMMSHSDVLIVCSIFLVGKPLCMHTGTAMVSSAHLLASRLESPIITKAPNPIVSF